MQLKFSYHKRCRWSEVEFHTRCKVNDSYMFLNELEDADYAAQELRERLREREMSGR